MVNEMGLIPDLAGSDNILISHDKRYKGRVYLVDMNNIQPVLSQNLINIQKLKQLTAIDPTVERIEDLTQRDLREIYHVVVFLRQKFYAVLHPQFLDEYGYPVADVSLSVLQEWEWLLGLPDRDDPYRDLIPRFSLREWVVRRVLEDLQGGVRLKTLVLFSCQCDDILFFEITHKICLDHRLRNRIQVFPNINNPLDHLVIIHTSIITHTRIGHIIC